MGTKLTEQIKDNPPVYQIEKHFGPSICHVKLPERGIKNLTKMTDDLLKNPNTVDHGKNLVSLIHNEKYIYQQDFIDAGVNSLLEGCVRAFIEQHAKKAGMEENFKISTRINSAWIVSQKENEYNPIHAHSRSEISGVIYIKTPDVTGRRKIKSKEGHRENDGDILFPYSSSDREEDILSNGVIQIKPEKGLMLIFPSWLLHTVYPFVGKGERRSISFNANYMIHTPDNQWVAGSNEGLNSKFQYWDKNKKQ